MKLVTSGDARIKWPMSDNPYADFRVTDKKFLREFTATVEADELVWHRDKKNRTVTVLEGTGWKFQYDNKLPKEIKPGDVITIKACEYHRILKGETTLKLEIVEDENS